MLLRCLLAEATWQINIFSVLVSTTQRANTRFTTGLPACQDAKNLHFAKI